MVTILTTALGVVLASPAGAVAAGCKDTAPKWSVEQNFFTPVGIPPWVDVAWFRVRIHVCWDNHVAPGGSAPSMYYYSASIPNDSTSVGSFLGFDISVKDKPETDVAVSEAHPYNIVTWNANVTVKRCAPYSGLTFCDFTSIIHIHGYTMMGRTSPQLTSPYNHRTVTCGNLACSIYLRVHK